MARIGIDVDGVLYPWADAANQVLVEKFGVPDPGPHVHWYHLKDCISPEQWRWVWSDEGMQIIFAKDLFYRNAQAFATLLNSDFECHFVTHRKPAVLGGITADYLAWLFPESSWEGLHVCGSTRKTEILNFDFFVDDKPETAVDMVSCGVVTYVPRRPWNLQLEEEVRHQYKNLVFYTDPQEVVEDLMRQQ